MIKTQNKRLSLLVLLVSVVLLLSCILTVFPAGATTISDIEQENHVLFAAEDGYYTLEDSTLTRVAAKDIVTTNDLAYLSSKKDVNGSDITLIESDVASAGLVSKQGLVFRFNSVNVGSNRINKTVVFNNPVDLEYVKSITIRMYARLSSSSTFTGGFLDSCIRLYSYGDNGTNQSGYVIPNNTTQNQWIYLTISGADLEKLATDNNGVKELKGLQVGGVVYSTDDSKFYVTKASQGKAYIVIDYITYEFNDAKYNKDQVTKDGERLLASSDNAENLVVSNLINVNTLPYPDSGGQRTAADIYSSEVNGSANSTVWTMNFHSSLATRITKSIQFTNPVSLSDVESITIRLNAHLSPTEGMYFTGMGGVMFCKLSETDCRKTDYSVSLAQSIEQDKWIDFTISGVQLAKLVEDDGTIKGVQIASDTRGWHEVAGSFYSGSPNEKQSWLLIDYIYYTPKYTVDFEDESGKIDGMVGTTVGEKVVLPEYNAPNSKLFIGWKLTVGGFDYLYKAGDEITLSQNAVLSAVTIDFTMNTGASIRVGSNADESGLRFAVRYNTAQYEQIQNFILSRGVIIVPTESLKLKEFIIDNFVPNDSSVEMINRMLLVEGTNVFTDGEDTMFTGVMKKVNSNNYAKEFSARGYIEINYTNGAGYIYTDYDETKHSRSVKYVAQAVKADTEVYESFNATQQAVIDAYAAAQ